MQETDRESTLKKSVGLLILFNFYIFIQKPIIIKQNCCFRLMKCQLNS